MRTRALVATSLIVLAFAASAVAQQPAPASAPPAAPAKVAPTAQPSPQPAAQLSNIRIDVVITETGPTPSKKTVSTVVADGARGSVRTFSRPDAGPGPNPAGPGGGNINVDVRPRIERNGMIRVLVVVEYRAKASLQFEPLLESGRTLIASEAPDALTPDSSVVVAITATVLK